MRIVFSGTHGTGKTTLLNFLKEKTNLKNIFLFIDEVTRTLQKEEGIKINENGDDESQIKLALKHYEILKKEKNVIMDRCLLDVMCYTKYLYLSGRCSEEALIFVETLFKSVKYDLIFYIEPEFNLVEDGVRSVNTEFRDEIKDIFRHYIKYFNIDVIKVGGSVDERIKLVKKEINNYLLKTLL